MNPVIDLLTSRSESIYMYHNQSSSNVIVYFNETINSSPIVLQMDIWCIYITINYWLCWSRTSRLYRVDENSYYMHTEPAIVSLYMYMPITLFRTHWEDAMVIINSVIFNRIIPKASRCIMDCMLVITILRYVYMHITCITNVCIK